MEESDRGTRYENEREHGISHYWIVLDFEKGATPILPSRMEIEIDGDFSKEVLSMVHRRFCDAITSVCKELAHNISDLKQRRNAIMKALKESTEDYMPYRRRRESESDFFCNIALIQEAAVELYSKYCPVHVQTADGAERYLLIADLKKEAPGVFISEVITKSPLFKVYAKSKALREWAIVVDTREYVLFRKAISSLEWKGFGAEQDIYAERMQVFTEVYTSPLTNLLRGDYAVIADQIFGKEAFIVLPSKLPGSWKRGEAAGYLRSAVSEACPPRILVNSKHPLTAALSEFVTQAQSEGASSKLRELKLLFDSLCDGVIENDRVTVARERWKTIQREMRQLLGGNLIEVIYETLVTRR